MVTIKLNCRSTVLLLSLVVLAPTILRFVSTEFSLLSLISFLPQLFLKAASLAVPNSQSLHGLPDLISNLTNVVGAVDLDAMRAQQDAMHHGVGALQRMTYLTRIQKRGVIDERDQRLVSEFADQLNNLAQQLETSAEQGNNLLMEGEVFATTTGPIYLKDIQRAIRSNDKNRVVRKFDRIIGFCNTQYSLLEEYNKSLKKLKTIAKELLIDAKIYTADMTEQIREHTLGADDSTFFGRLSLFVALVASVGTGSVLPIVGGLATLHVGTSKSQYQIIKAREYQRIAQELIQTAKSLEFVEGTIRNRIEMLQGLRTQWKAARIVFEDLSVDFHHVSPTEMKELSAAVDDSVAAFENLAQSYTSLRQRLRVGHKNGNELPSP